MLQTRYSAKWVKVRLSFNLTLAALHAHYCLLSASCVLTITSAGTFGRVLECWDRKHRTYVAIKIVRNVKKYRDAAMIEVDLSLRLSACPFQLPSPCCSVSLFSLTCNLQCVYVRAVGGAEHT